MEELDRKEATFEVEDAIPAPAGHILGFMAKRAGGDWKTLGTEKFTLNETIQLSVSWQSDLVTHSLKGRVELTVRRPNLQYLYPTPVSGQDTIVGPNGSASVIYQITLDQKGTVAGGNPWKLGATLYGAIVA